MNQFHLDEATLNEYVDGMLSTTELVEIEAHLVSCEECRNSLAELQWLLVELDNFPEEQLSRDLAASTVAILNARAIQVRSPSLAIVTIQIFVTVIIASLLWPLLSQPILPTTRRWLQPLQLQGARLQLEVNWTALRASGEQLTQTLITLSQQVGERWLQGRNLPPLPELSITLWLALLAGICLLWVMATRWLVLVPTAHHSLYTGASTQEMEK